MEEYSGSFADWAADYDIRVKAGDEADTYPFAGYGKMLDCILKKAAKNPGGKALDLGFGSGKLLKALAAKGWDVWGIDQKIEAVDSIKKALPNGHFYTCDITVGLPEEIKQQRFDCIMSTFVLHHFPVETQLSIIKQLKGLLSPGGVILNGDICYPTRRELEDSQAKWDFPPEKAEKYLVFEELELPTGKLIQLSHCIGIVEIR